MSRIKKLISYLIIILVLYLIIGNYSKIKEIINIEFNNKDYDSRKLNILPSNEYSKKFDYLYVLDTDYVPDNYKELNDIIYNIVNNGWDNFTFYCSDTYLDCLNDISNMKDLDFNYINDFVHPFNSFTNLGIVYDSTGKITIEVNHIYSDDDINYINNEIDRIIKNIINDNMSNRDKIKAFHDYIAKNTKYDKDMEDYNESIYDSKRMNGLLKDHYAVCSAYSDIMAVFLTKIGIDNFKVSAYNHVWNALYLDNKWFHLDLTWDDPYNVDTISYDYFIISDKKLTELSNKLTDYDKKVSHQYNKDIYLELSN